MFGLLKRKRPIVFEQWIVPILDFTSDAPKFYAAVEAEIHKWEVPELVTERITYKDGGFLSAGREYLRVRREALVFDILSAKFGKSWWFSCRSAVLPRTLRGWEVLVFIGAIVAFTASYWYAFGVFTGNIAIASTLGMLLALMMSARSWNGLDDLLLKLPVIGAIYEALFRAESYYRDDARRMYVSVVDHLVRATVREFTKGGGFDEVQFNEVSDIKQFSTAMDRVKVFVGEKTIEATKEIARALLE
jgi:hypothetical protein